jgi:ribonucleotide monophosphatase NagD (HAD superfamily)
MPAIACDIDGVILRGCLIIGNSNKMIQELLAPRHITSESDSQKSSETTSKKNLPFTLLTNGGGFVEERKAEEINAKLHFEGDKQLKLNHTHIIQCHTPLREKALVDQYKGKYVLVCGYDEVLNAAISYGYDRAIHVDELAAVYPNAVPIDIPM